MTTESSAEKRTSSVKALISVSLFRWTSSSWRRSVSSSSCAPELVEVPSRRVRLCSMAGQAVGQGTSQKSPSHAPVDLGSELVLSREKLVVLGREGLDTSFQARYVRPLVGVSRLAIRAGVRCLQARYLLLRLSEIPTQLSDERSKLSSVALRSLEICPCDSQIPLSLAERVLVRIVLDVVAQAFKLGALGLEGRVRLGQRCLQLSDTGSRARFVRLGRFCVQWVSGQTSRA